MKCRLLNFVEFQGKKGQNGIFVDEFGNKPAGARFYTDLSATPKTV
jgi:hypothetical protein